MRKFLYMGILSTFLLTACTEDEAEYPTPTDSEIEYPSITGDEDESSPYTEEELEADPTAPSTNVNDYNSDGEYVPENGPSDNPADYNSNGEYKPVEDMTDEEIVEELESMFNN